MVDFWVNSNTAVAIAIIIAKSSKHTDFTLDLIEIRSSIHTFYSQKSPLLV